MRILYFLLLKPLSLLPVGVLHGLSTFFYFIVFRLVGYRKDVIFTNLRNSFPNKDEREIAQIADEFQRHFCDQIIESVKMFSISKKELGKRVEFANPEVLDAYTSKNRSVILCGGHYNNWEWAAVALPLFSDSIITALYTPLTNKFMNKQVTGSRTQYGMNMVSRYGHKDLLERAKKNGQVIVFATDQSPKGYSKKIWTDFLNQRTAVFKGAENFARQLDAAVFFVNIEKKKRGYYFVEFSLITDRPLSLEEGLLTEIHTRVLEKEILSKPAYWLWSHKRWKLKEEDKKKNEN